jgi:hypothetical protein
MRGRQLVSGAALFAVLAAAAACASAPVGEGAGGDTVLQFVDIRNESGEPVQLTARVGASEEQRLGFLEPGGYRRFEIPTGAASTGNLFLRARNPQTGREATTTLQVDAARTLEWRIRLF